MRSIKGGGLLMEAQLDPTTVMKLCVWEAHCEECEEHEAFGDSSEPESQGA